MRQLRSIDFLLQSGASQLLGVGFLLHGDAFELRVAEGEVFGVGEVFGLFRGRVAVGAGGE